MDVRVVFVLSGVAISVALPQEVLHHNRRSLPSLKKCFITTGGTTSTGTRWEINATRSPAIPEGKPHVPRLCRGRSCCFAVAAIVRALSPQSRPTRRFWIVGAGIGPWLRSWWMPPYRPGQPSADRSHASSRSTICRAYSCCC
jgi:hypothetical protein